MSQYNFEQIDVPAGAFMSWAEQPGQMVVGKVLSYSPAGGSNFAGEPCPQLSVELLDAAYAVNKAGQRFDFGAGELLVINGGLANLRKALVKADPRPGDVIKLVFARFEQTSKGSVKVFDVFIARGAAPVSQAPAQAAPAATAWTASSTARAPF